MPTPTKGTRFGGSPAHQRLMLANLAQSLFEHGSIKTTEAKAKRLRPYAESLITKAKTDTIANRRRVVRVIRDKDILHTLFAEIGPRYATRPGGYTRIVKLEPRKGDNAPMAVIELVEEKTFEPQNQEPKQKATVAAPVEEDAAETATDEAAEPEASVEEAAAESTGAEDTGANATAEEASAEATDDAATDDEK